MTALAKSFPVVENDSPIDVSIACTLFMHEGINRDRISWVLHSPSPLRLMVAQSDARAEIATSLSRTVGGFIIWLLHPTALALCKALVLNSPNSNFNSGI